MKKLKIVKLKSGKEHMKIAKAEAGADAEVQSTAEKWCLIALKNKVGELHQAVESLQEQIIELQANKKENE